MRTGGLRIPGVGAGITPKDHLGPKGKNPEATCAESPWESDASFLDAIWDVVKDWNSNGGCDNPNEAGGSVKGLLKYAVHHFVLSTLGYTISNDTLRIKNEFHQCCKDNGFTGRVMLHKLLPTLSFDCQQWGGVTHIPFCATKVSETQAVKPKRNQSQGGWVGLWIRQLSDSCRPG